MPMIVSYGMPRIFTSDMPSMMEHDRHFTDKAKIASDKSLRHADDSELRYTENIYFWHAVHDGKWSAFHR